MGKQQLSTLDVAAEVAYLRRHALDMHLINVFDVNNKTYILKLGISGDDGKKLFILLESGRRLHMTKYERSHSDFPSNFNLKLRKHIRNRKLTNIQQLGVDRIVDFTFGYEDKSIHLILEIFAQGNIILTDAKYEVLTLLRTHLDADQNYCLMPKRPYPLDHIRMPKSISEEDVIAAFRDAEEGKSNKSIIMNVLPYGSACAEHVLKSAEIEPSQKMTAEQKENFDNENAFQRLMSQIKTLEGWFKLSNQDPPEGYILLKEKKEESENEVYIEFEPFLLFQHKTLPHKKYSFFNEAVDEFFSKIEGQKLALAEAAAEAAAEARLMKTKLDLEMRAAQLKKEAENEDLQGQLIEYNLKSVEEVLLAVNSVLAQGLSWDEIETLIKNEAEAGNPVAGLIHTLKLEQNVVIILLENIREEHNEAEKSPKAQVELNLSLGAAANARAHYEKRKKHALKEQRTHEANELAMKAAEKKVKSEMKKSKTKKTMQPLRKAHWFEKFNWFITSENYLVISGRDAQQNELLVKKYMRPEDLYVHADLHGASTTIIRNNRPEMQIPPISLQEAGNACVCRSKAWENKIITSAWWVYSHQVSKSAPSGEYLTTGSFMIRGKKNYLPPVSLIFGFGFLFKVQESDIDRHKMERYPKSLEAQNEDPALRFEHKDTVVEENEIQELEVEKSALDVFMEGSVDPLSKSFDQKVKINDEADLLSAAIENQKESGKKKISAKEKRKIKKDQKAKLPQEQVKDLAEDKEEVEEKKTSVTEERTENETFKPDVKWKPSKKKGKRREKDAEDVKLMTELLQSTGEKKSKQQRRDERKQKKAAKKAANQPNMNQPTEEEIQTMISKATEVPFMDEESEAESEDQHHQKESEQMATVESDEDQEEEITELQQLESLTGIPHAEDTVLFAVPVCAPYDCLIHYKYKIKLLPGTLKKGKAGKQAVELLLHVRDGHQRDLQLMKDVPETEVTNVMMPSVKLAMPGMQKFKQNQKSKKKKKTQQQE